MTAPPAPDPFINLGTLPLTGPPSVRWSPGPGVHGAAITDLGGAQVFTYSEDQAAALEAAFAEAGRMHRAAAEGGQR